MAHVGEILAELHNDRELSQKELGRVLHIGGGTISCYERGSSLPNSDRIVQIADYFHVTTDYILNKSGKEIAADLKMSPDNVRMAIVRAKRRAREAMEVGRDSKEKK